MSNFLSSKLHPTVTYIKGALEKVDAGGQKFDAAAEALNRFMPMLVADGYDLYKEHGPIGLLGMFPSMLGMGTQTYGAKIPNMEKTASGNPTIKLKSVGGISEDIMYKIRGTQESNIPVEQRQGLVTKIQGEKQATADLEMLKAKLQEGGAATAGDVQSAPDLKTAKLLFEYSPDQYTQVGDSYLYKDPKTNAIKTVDLKIIEKPKLTGDYAIDKSLKSKYNSAISTQISGVVDLYSMGALTQEQASQIVNTLTNSKISGAKKPKAIAKIAKVSTPKTSYKIASSKAKSKLKGVTIAKRPNLKLAKTANAKTIKMDYGKVPVFKIAKIKGLTTGVKLV